MRFLTLITFNSLATRFQLFYFAILVGLSFKVCKLGFMEKGFFEILTYI